MGSRTWITYRLSTRLPVASGKVNVGSLDEDAVAEARASSRAACGGSWSPSCCTLKIYAGAPHGLCSTHTGQVNAELLAFSKA